MPAAEFDAYLKTLFAGLRLKPGRRAELADELRDHLETRLEELAAAGRPRAAAVQQALEEFGDAAGLASQMSYAFTVLARRRRRKTLMRVTASAAATLACGIAVAYLFAPPNRAVNPPGPALAQDDPGSTAEPAESGADPFGAPPPPSPDEAKIAALEAALNAPTSLTELRPGDVLADTLDDLAEQHSIVILPDGHALDLEGLDLRDLPIENPPKLSGYSLRTTLKLLLSSVNEAPLAAVPRDGILFITTQEKAGLELETRIYNVRDLLVDVRATSPAGGLGGVPAAFGGGQGGGAGMFSLPPVHNQFGSGMLGGRMGEGMSMEEGKGEEMGYGESGYGMGEGMSGGMGGGMSGGMSGGFGGGATDPGGTAGAADELVGMILSVTGGAEFGGPWILSDGSGGSIEHFNGLLAVRQTAAVHRQIEDLLAALRRSAAERGWDAAEAGEPAAAAPGNQDPVVVEVGPNGIRSLNGGLADGPEEYREVLTRIGREEPSRPIVIRADANVPARVVQEVFKRLKEAGAKEISLQAQPAVPSY